MMALQRHKPGLACVRTNERSLLGTVEIMNEKSCTQEKSRTYLHVFLSHRMRPSNYLSQLNSDEPVFYESA